MLRELTEYSVQLNTTFTVLMISGTILSTLILFSILYFIYVEPTKLVLYSLSLFTFSVLTLILNSILVLHFQSTITLKQPRLLLFFNNINGLFLIYSMYLVITFFFKNELRIAKKFLLFLIPVMSLLGLHFDNDWLFSFLYMIVAINISIFYYTREIRDHASKQAPLIMLGLVSPVFYYVIHYFLKLEFETKARLDGYMLQILTVTFLFYFMFRYKHIIKDKNRLYRILTIDSLTGAFSKSLLMEKFAATESGIIFFIDINHFKWLNDTYGHSAGDHLLATFSNEVFKILPENILMARYGGDEFVLLATDLSIEESQFFAINLINLFKESLKKTVDQTDDVGISIGISTYTDYESHQGLIKADQAMYRGKKSGNNKIIVNLNKEVAPID